MFAHLGANEVPPRPPVPPQRHDCPQLAGDRPRLAAYGGEGAGWGWAPAAAGASAPVTYKYALSRQTEDVRPRRGPAPPTPP
ncbi:hypothetical protein GCM10010233_01120 [Streptomyces pseudogriseolus]|nr:hypothetical protein GCM10010233_01120 [Streptomyces gancidicus]